MQKHLLYINLFTITSALALGACADEVENTVTPEVPEVGEKTPIELSVGGVDGVEQSSSTRASASAVITDGTNKTMETFTKNTKIFMVMMSEYDTDHVDFDDPDNPHVKKFTVSRGDVTANSTAVTFDDLNKKYWDDAHARSSMISIWGFAQQGIPQGTGWLSGSFDIPNTQWDGTDPLTEYKQETYSTATTRYNWVKDTGKSKGEIYPCINTWKTSHNTDASVQDGTSILYQDLLFTNNIADNTGYSKSDGRLKFDFNTRKFPTGANAQLKFYHAMSKITIQIKKGDGFTTNDNFAFATGKNVELKGFNTEGTFNIKEGEFQRILQSYPITKIYQWTTAASGSAYTLEALAIPNIHEFMVSQRTADNNDLKDDNSRFVKDKKNLASDVMMEFTIDNNKYQITSGQLYDALHVHDNGVPTATLVTNATEKTDNGNYIPLEAGKNYVFTFTIGKTKIQNITAQVVGWEDVVATPQTPSNARITLKVEERGDAQTSGVSLYRAKDADSPTSPTDTYKGYNWDAGYADMNATYSTSNSRWETNLFWDSNNDYYHFRALSPTGQTINTATSQPDNISLTSSSCANADSYNQLAWGAPFMDDDYNDVSETFKFTYDRTNGFDVNRTSGSESVKQIYHAIGATEDPIKIIMFHMMSGVHFTIKTTGSADSNTDKVELYRAASGSDPAKRTKVELIGYYSTGKVLLGTGYVGVTGTNTSATVISFASATDDGAYTDQEYFYSAVPQSLENVELVITTPDNNQYKVALKNVTATSVTSNNVSVTYTDNKLDYWYPGFKYNYTLTLKKTGITDLKATIVEWEEVTADDEVQIK